MHVVICYEFGGDSGVNLRVFFVKVCEGFNLYDKQKIKFNRWKHKIT